MVREKVRWKATIILYLISLNVLTKSLPVEKPAGRSITTTETAFINAQTITIVNDEEKRNTVTIKTDNVEEAINTTSNVSELHAADVANLTRSTLLRNIRPGQEVRRYTVSITFNGNEFTGRAVLDVVIPEATIGENLFFHFDNVQVQNVLTGVFTEASALPAESFDLDDGILEIEPVQEAVSYIVVVEYTGTLSNDGRGLYLGEGSDFSYIGMNLHPTYARRVFPCMDEPTEASFITFTFNNLEYENIITNSILDDTNTNEGANQFRSLQNPPNLWGMIAHDFRDLNIPIANVILVGRQTTNNQDAQASLAINAYFDYLNEWTERTYFEIVFNQATQMRIVALPDVDREWNALSGIGIWEPHVLMENAASVQQRKTMLVKVAEAMSKQWFGYMIYPHNWRHQWVISGLATYTAYEAVNDFQTPTGDTDVTLLDANTLFQADVIREGLLRDAYINAGILEPTADLFDENAVREHINGVVKYKAPAIMKMLRLIIGNADNDLIQSSARAMLAGRALQTVSSQNFFDAVNSAISFNGEGSLIDNVGEFLNPWLHNNGYPLINVGLWQDGVMVTQERFSFTSQPYVKFDVPLSFTTSVAPNFDDVRPTVILDSTVNIPTELGEEDWVIFNVQGQGYYRVTYELDLWERIIEALEDPERREVIHPLNRATLVDDALNLARAGRINYEIALRIVLSMEHETEYAVWKAFVRNMEFLRKRLIALITEDDDLDPDIYVRMIRRTIGSVENELGFDPDPLLIESSMSTLTRGLVMYHACKANYEPCIAAAVDWFYDPNNSGAVNPNIPYDIRPAVYCTMVREGGDDVIEALNARLEAEASHYERIVIMESMACSQDDNFILGLLDETVTPGNRYLVEERVKIFKAVAESSYGNARNALNFIIRRTQDIRNMYGGEQKLEEVILTLAENMVEDGMATDFRVWVNAQNNNLDDSQDFAERAVQLINEGIAWNNNMLEPVYEWIDENDAPTLTISLILVSITFIITLFNN